MISNPFEYEGANRLSDEQILDYYQEDYTYSRFIHSKRNIFLVGERGTGKTMTLKYNSFQVMRCKAKREGTSVDTDIICIYVPCNTPLTHRPDHELYSPSQAFVINEHFLVLPLLYELATALEDIPEGRNRKRTASLFDELEYSLDLPLERGPSLFRALRLLFQREIVLSQQMINTSAPAAFRERPFSFLSTAIPVLTVIRGLRPLKRTHFSFLIDDAHLLNPMQNKILNSWIAFRDNTLFSFKVASSKVGQPPFLTRSGGDILEGHDYTLVDLEQPYQNEYSSFGRLANRIVRSRLDKINVPSEITPAVFFPENPTMRRAIDRCEEQVRKEKLRSDPRASNKQVSDYVYKYGRARYFRERSRKANRPPYSGFEQIVHLSTGVIRNLLEPCYRMYEAVLSSLSGPNKSDGLISAIPPSVQTSVIRKLSKQRWETLRNGLDSAVENCTREQAQQLRNLFDQLARLFLKRLLEHKSEPRAIVFSVSGVGRGEYEDLRALLQIARRAQLLYTYTSSGKETGKRETYYVPNRILWPEKGLDPVGQYSRVSIQAVHLWEAARSNRPIPISRQPGAHEGELFEHEQ